jgi:hypothetical protein
MRGAGRHHSTQSGNGKRGIVRLLVNPEAARDRAAERAKQLKARQAELSTGKPVTQEDAALAKQRAEDARIRAAQAHVRAAERHHHAAAVHRDAAELHEQAAGDGVGDVAVHRTSAEAHRLAADDDERAAVRDLIEAQAEEQS